MKQRFLMLLRAVRARYFARCQQANETETLVNKPICLLAHREDNLNNVNMNIGHVNLVVLVNGNSTTIQQLNTILEEGTNICHTKTSDHD